MATIHGISGKMTGEEICKAPDKCLDIIESQVPIIVRSAKANHGAQPVTLSQPASFSRHWLSPQPLLSTSTPLPREPGCPPKPARPGDQAVVQRAECQLQAPSVCGPQDSCDWDPDFSLLFLKCFTARKPLASPQKDANKGNRLAIRKCHVRVHRGALCEPRAAPASEHRGGERRCSCILPLGRVPLTLRAARNGGWAQAMSPKPG